MNPEYSMGYQEKEFKPKAKIDAEPFIVAFIPEEFKKDPFKYFEEKGINIKPGEVKIDETGRVREDPTAVKELPTWQDKDGRSIEVIGKKVNIQKGQIEKSGDPFYEYKVMELVSAIDLPVARPLAKVKKEGNFLIVMEKIKGLGWYSEERSRLEEKGFSPEDIENLQKQAEEMVLELKKKFDEAGIVRGWKLKDMIFDIDFENKRIKKIVPTDWERTKIDSDKFTKHINKKEK